VPCCDLDIQVTPPSPRVIPCGLFADSALAWIITEKCHFRMLTPKG
jgi:hypothetical protein